jgi:2-methylcitrate dehydratase PrpD
MYSQELSDYCYDVKFSDLNEKTVNMAKMCVADLIGVAIAATATPLGKNLAKYFFKEVQQPQSTAWRVGFDKGDYRDMAAFNSACSHALDYDDVHNATFSHISALTVPSALAIGQREKSAGKDVIAALVAGYEIAARAGMAINPAAYYYWHTTGTVGAFGAGMVTGKLIGITKEQMRHCIGNAGTQAAGLWEFNADGANSKTLHTANANLCGMRAAELAAVGFTGASRIFEGEKGYVRALAPKFDMDALIRDLDKNQYQILSNSFKPYACCRHTHSADYCAIEMVKKFNIDPKKIKKVVDHTYKVALDVTDMGNPLTQYAHKFSLQYCIAAAFVYQQLTPPVFTDEKINNPDVQRLMKNVDVVLDEKLNQEFLDNPTKWSHKLDVTMEDGTVHTMQVDYPIGDFQNPFDWAMLENKFFAVTDGVLPMETGRKLIDNVKKLDTLDDVNKIFAL